MKKTRSMTLAAQAVLLFAVNFAASTLWADEAMVETKIDELLAKMTLEEKAGQLNQYTSAYDLTGPAPDGEREQRLYDDLVNGRVGSMLNVTGAEATLAAQKLVVENSRLGIPLIFGYDVIHGYRTMFPMPFAESASWDLEAMERSARIAGIEAAAAGLHWTFAPMVDISRDARWGRVVEGAGEDPYLASLIAAARVRGFQGDDLAATDTIAACAKHFAAYGLAEAGRDYNTVDISADTLHNMVLPPFYAANQAGAQTFMNAFNEIGGEPATSSHYLQTELLKGAWGFDGFIISDWGSIQELIPHGVARDKKHAAELAINAGNDMDMESSAYRNHLVELVNEGLVDESRVDDAVRRVLRVKFRLGLMDDPYRYSDSGREKEAMMREEFMAASLDIARKSIVLLKNDGVLPLDRKGTIAVIGPLAADKNTPIGSWRAQGEDDSAVSLLEGIRAAAGDELEVLYAKGADLAVGPRNFVNELSFNTTDRSGFAEAVEVAGKADVVVLALGEDAFQSAEGRSQVDVGLKGLQMELLDAVLEANRNVVVVLQNGRPLVLTEVEDKVPGLVEAWQLGSQAGHAMADVLFGDHNPSGKLTASFPRHVGQLPIYYNHRNTGRPVADSPDLVFWSHYTDAPNSPLYPFGYGLSYTSFAYSEPVLSSSGMGMDGKVTVSVNLRNTGDRAGTEVAQLYIRDLVGSVTRPVKELKGFRRVELAAGETVQINFELTADDLAFYTGRGKWEAEPGEFEVFVGGSSAVEQSVRFELTE